MMMLSLAAALVHIFSNFKWNEVHVSYQMFECNFHSIAFGLYIKNRKKFIFPVIYNW